MNYIDRALIIRRLSNSISIAYAETCVESCKKHGLDYELIDAVENISCPEAFKSVGVQIGPKYTNTQGNCCCHSSHIKCWKRIVELNKPCVILEHDAIVCGDVTKIELPDMAVVTFGHRVLKVNDYTPIKPIETLKRIPRAIGVHACGLTPVTAKWLWEDAKTNGIHIGIDRYLMMQTKSGLPLYVSEPEQIVCWARLSTSNPNKNARINVTNYQESFSKYWVEGLRTK